MAERNAMLLAKMIAVRAEKTPGLDVRLQSDLGPLAEQTSDSTDPCDHTRRRAHE